MSRAAQGAAVQPTPPQPIIGPDQAAQIELKKSKLQYLNKDGKMLMYRLTLDQREGAPDPQTFIINEETYVIRRGIEVVVPWYLALHLHGNIETKFTPQKDDRGRLQMIPRDGLAEPFRAQAIDPAGETPL